MFKRLFGLSRSPNEKIVDSLYEQIVAAARQPRFYADWLVPDTPTGRFGMLWLHMLQFVRRSRHRTEALGAIAQETVDMFFTEIDHSLRELGISDTGVPRRMKKLARMFYGRTQTYTQALEAGDRTAMAEALARNVAPADPAWSGADDLAAYALAADRALALQSDAAIVAGNISFAAPAPAEVEP